MEAMRVCLISAMGRHGTKVEIREVVLAMTMEECHCMVASVLNHVCNLKNQDPEEFAKAVVKAAGAQREAAPTTGKIIV